MRSTWCGTGRFILAGLVSCCASVAWPALGMAARNEVQRTLYDALKQIDAASREFRNASASVEVEHVVAGKDTTNTGSGRIYIRKDGRMRIDLEEPDPRTILCLPSELLIYKPAMSIVETYRLARHPDRLEQYPRLGFSIAGTQLEEDYLVTLMQEASVEGRKVMQLELTPKEEAVRSDISKINLWIDEGTWLPVKQEIFHSDAGTHLTLTYRDLSRNVPFDRDLFKAKWPKGTEKVKR